VNGQMNVPVASTLDRKVFWLEQWRVDSACGKLQMDSDEVHVELKVMAVLLILAERAGEVVSREELEARAWPGLVVGYDALSSSIIKLRRALGDDSRNPRYIETVSKKGYRLIAAVSYEARSEPESNAVPEAKPGMWLDLQFNKPVVAVLTLLLLLFGALLRGWDKPPETPFTEKPAIAVLPFSNFSDDPSQEYFSDGLAEELINDLSQLSGLLVISRRSTFAYKTRTVSLQTLAQELGIQYVLEGSVRRVKEQIRITVQLVDAKSGINLWAGRFERDNKNLFHIQDEVRQKIVSLLSIKINEKEWERQRKQYTVSFPAYDLFLQGQASLVKRGAVTDYHKARDYFERAIHLDPKFARAHSALALAHTDAFRFSWVGDDVAKLALEQVKLALELNPGLPQAYWVAGYAHLYLQGDHQKAISKAQRCIELDPNNADAHLLLAAIYVLSDQAELALPLVQTAKRLNPHYPSMYPSVQGQAYLSLQNYDSAYAAFEESLQINPRRYQGNLYMIITLKRMGRLDDAVWQAQQFLMENPGFNPAIWVQHQPFLDQGIADGMKQDLDAVFTKAQLS